VASGSLGQGLSVACGAALSKKLNGDDRKVFVLMGDGEQQEGQVWEAAMYAAHNRIDNLIATIDLNGQQIDGPVDKILSLLNLKSKYESFGWDVLEISEGNSMNSVLIGLEEAILRSGKGKPVMILLKTEMGFGVDFMMHSHKWHGVAPNDEQLEKALTQLPSDFADFVIN
jgi:transketolase